MVAPRPRPGILEITPYVGGKAETEAGGPAVKLSANESAIGPSPKAIEAYRAVAGSLHRYPDGACTKLRAAIGRRFNLDPERIVCGAGSDELIALLVRAYAGPGDEVLHSAHGFLMYRLAALAAGAHPVAAPERELKADVDALLARVSSRTRILFLANPNNPTGSYLSAEELARLRAGLPEDVLLVIDAAYAEFVSAPDYASGLELAREHENVVTTRTFSKLFGLAALRVGWMYGSPRVVDVINRIRGPFNVSQPAQEAAIAALEDTEHQARAKAHNDRWLPWLRERLLALGLRVYPSVGNFLLVEFPREPGRDAAAAEAFLERHGLIPRAMGAYGLPHALRISVGLEHDNHKLVEVLRAFLEGPPHAGAL
ncbi:MAG: histidinol-phosphate transaminase [Geminicoccaceae bacterium]|nr:histidinol-phosphate transaminase [Geminicoccaceae bacterium]MCS7267539.1 histidinol-phosphate transaminase [Geminicoccaceae bacterium]MDW8123744.1 histidinol-phosphate transaminase [Geminicoccaceae bacterium]MDW8341837.1 histidinol-phosphate transaminase [Geminicoccaceae bacterium]